MLTAILFWAIFAVCVLVIVWVLTRPKQAASEPVAKNLAEEAVESANRDVLARQARRLAMIHSRIRNALGPAYADRIEIVDDEVFVDGFKFTVSNPYYSAESDNYTTNISYYQLEIHLDRIGGGKPVVYTIHNLSELGEILKKRNEKVSG